MSHPTILVTRKLPSSVEQRLSKSYDVRLNATDELMTAEQLVESAKGADGLLVSLTEKFSPEVIAALPDQVKIMATFSVGYDHINIPAAIDKGLIVTNTPDVLTDATAEIAFLLMLGAARGSTAGEKVLRDGEWGVWSPTGMLGLQLTGRRLGILGMGRIGQATAKRARAFGMEIHYHSRTQLTPEQEQGAIYHATAEELLAQSDVFSIHCASTDETRGFLNAERINLLPQDAIVVNSARGDIVDDDALIEALNSRRIWAAGLDVFLGEPAIDPRYHALENSFLLPHMGSATRETRDAMGHCAVDNLDAFFAGKTPPNVVS